MCAKHMHEDILHISAVSSTNAQTTKQCKDNKNVYCESENTCPISASVIVSHVVTGALRIPVCNHVQCAYTHMKGREREREGERGRGREGGREGVYHISPIRHLVADFERQPLSAGIGLDPGPE